VTPPTLSRASASTTVIGLGNEFLSDDGLGILAVRQVADRFKDSDITFQELSVGGLELLDHLVGYKRCIIVDAIATGRCPPGTICRLIRTPASEAVTISSSHQIDLTQVLTLAHLLGADTPESVTVYGIEARDITTFRTETTPEIARSLPALVDAICSDLRGTQPLQCESAGGWQVIQTQAGH
jgi:hydrogenase maturation protease